MKYLVLLCDGMADTPVPELGGKTPMEAAQKPNMDALAREALVGTAKTVPDGMKPGSDVANLSALGYHPADCYTGRSPLEAASIGVDLAPDEYAIRCNLVTLSDEPAYADKSMVDYCAGDISTAEATELIHFLAEHLPEGVRLYPGVSYRHCLVWKNPAEDIGELTPPHDISGQKITGRLPDPAKAGVLLELMEKSFDLLKNHPVNQKRVAEGKRPANSMWFWGQGRKAALRPFKELYGLNASVISAVDLIKGIGILAKMEVLDVPGPRATSTPTSTARPRRPWTPSPGARTWSTSTWRPPTSAATGAKRPIRSVPSSSSTGKSWGRCGRPWRPRATTASWCSPTIPRPWPSGPIPQSRCRT